MLSRRHHPYCPADCREDTHTFPVRPLVDVPTGHRLGKAGLDAVFTPGSMWNYGTCRENMDTVVRVRVDGKGADNSRNLVDYNQPGEPKTWFIDCEVVSSPHTKAYPVGKKVGLPPCALISHPAVLAQRARETGAYLCAAQDPSTAILAQAMAIGCEAENESLRQQLRDTESEVVKLKTELDTYKRKYHNVRNLADRIQTLCNNELSS